MTNTAERPLGPVAVVLLLAGSIVMILGMREFAGILGPFFLTVSLFIAAYPILPRMISLGIPRVVATVVLGLVIFLVLGAFGYALSWSISALITTLPEYQAQFTALGEQALDLALSLGMSGTELNDALQAVNPSSVVGVLQRLATQVSGVVGLVTVLVTMTFMMAIDAGTFSTRAKVLGRVQPRVFHALVDYCRGVRRYWLVTTIFGVIVAVIDVVALMLLGVPLALVWGVLSFLTNYIPNIGFLLGVIPPALMALLANDPLTALYVVIFYSVINFVIQAVIQPKFNGDAVGVTATVALLSLLLWSSVLGALGALLALPMTLLVKALFIDPDPRLRWLNTLISNDPEGTTEPAAR